MARTGWRLAAARTADAWLLGVRKTRKQARPGSAMLVAGQHEPCPRARAVESGDLVLHRVDGTRSGVGSAAAPAVRWRGRTAASRRMRHRRRQRTEQPGARRRCSAGNGLAPSIWRRRDAIRRRSSRSACRVAGVPGFFRRLTSGQQHPDGWGGFVDDVRGPGVGGDGARGDGASGHGATTRPSVTHVAGQPTKEHRPTTAG